jgi:putative tributyrin esterase
MRKIGTPLLTFSLAILLAFARSTSAEPPRARTIEYDSPSVGRTLKCTIILPVDYETSGRRYPVLYLLHGYSGDYTSWSRHGVEHAAEPYSWIVVLPDGGNSWFVNWAASEHGEKNDWEDAIIKDLIGYVDGHFRTVAARQGRAINGLSMGGYGALALGLRHPEMFCSVGSHSGAIEMARSCARQLTADPAAKVPARNPS